MSDHQRERGEASEPETKPEAGPSPEAETRPEAQPSHEPEAEPRPETATRPEAKSNREPEAEDRPPEPPAAPRPSALQEGKKWFLTALLVFAILAIGIVLYLAKYRPTEFFYTLF